MKVLGVIPARYQSTRLPGKPLLDIVGKPMIQWVYESAKTASLLDEVLVATDDQRICDAVRQFGGTVELTAADHPTGTDRLAEVARRHDADLIINIQGDEPLIRGEVIDSIIQPLVADMTLPMSTAKVRLTEPAQIEEPSVVKVVTDEEGYALYFSRSPIPYPRKAEMAQYWKHVGLYGYRREFLLKYVELPQTTIELTESLEQLRVLSYGYRIKVVEVAQDSVGVDTPADLERVRAILEQKII
ncbi:3-deoxy-manno-octulosonate cytidylyltransferase (CMP-KDO synthetase) [Hydrogenispora ethanolica]|jgi:3-deoxy-manno-octulosonate cytidylyltransferase (CMP-KDO synthetase)|uniref:3-deoxy-manno-octulosonate cytidylyltransferase n=1 Tax=Hydrogenispora ethanolica TaxID=1082276 RepID=A0A4R1RFS4_HYDET|nr:3-deoxy-manno-octulosonate cytidylyltransferase [Hydrogenispora ethanolica]TCL64791.1 3-deoxy-manno-octulosonate cytidylyltransferase (CMP-KDO synthetase) [Hydrogenispora ethanolica]